MSAVVRRLPRRVVLAIGRRLGRLWAALDPRHLAIAADNLRQAFPEWDEARVQATARGVYAHFATVLLDILWMEGRPVEELLALADVEGLEHLTGALARGLGVVSPLAHLGNWEFQGVTTAPLIGPSAVVARPLDNPALDRRLVAFRASTGNIVIYKQKALPEVLKNLREGRVVAIVVDQNVQAKDGIFVRFFGRPASATTVAAALALKTGCPIVPARCVLRARRALSHGVRPPGGVVELGPARRGPRPAHAGHRVDHRGLGARDPRAVAVAAPAVEDEAIPGDPVIPRDPRPSGSLGIRSLAADRAGAVPAEPLRRPSRRPPEGPSGRQGPPQGEDS